MADDPSLRRSLLITPMTNLALAVLGVLVVHQTAYSLTGLVAPSLLGGSPVDHGHQGWLMAVVGPLALWATAWFVLRQVRQTRMTPTWGAGSLSAAIAGLYLAQESIEVLTSAPAGSLLHMMLANPAIPIGLLIAPLITRALLRILEQAEDLLATWLGIVDEKPTDRTAPNRSPRTLAKPTGAARSPGNPRGPPRRDVTTIELLIS